MPQTRELRTLDEAVSLIEEWEVAYQALESQCIRLDRAWVLKYRELETDYHRLQALEYDTAYQRAVEDRANALESERPF